MTDPPPTVPALRRSVQRLSRRLRAERPTDGLSDLQLRVLAVVMDEGPMTSARMADRLRTSPQALTRTIAALTADGLLARTPVADDKRQHLLTIAPPGWAALRADAAPRDAWLTRATAELTDAELALLDIAATLIDRLAASTPDSTDSTDVRGDPS